MGLFDRVVLTLYTFFLALFSLAMVLVSAGWGYPLEFLKANLATVSGRWVTGIISAMLFVASLRLLYFGFQKRRGMQTVVHETSMGEVRISLDAIEDLVRRVGRQVQGVRDVKPVVTSGPSGLNVIVRTSVSPDVSIPQVSEELQTTVRNYVKNVVGATVAEVRVFVGNITTDSKRSRVE
ncbi:MAG: alkaline shock response membrane anchor protein AmaP [Firmicutes bacterium]|nr:alkaline shock response membrane anchor protein AmaP [Bacillota bacterium]